MLAENKIKNINIKEIEPILAQDVCRAISRTLPNWFAIPEANTRYETGILKCLSFAACINNNYVGMITLEFPYKNNANIYWMAVAEDYHHKNIGKILLAFAENYCRERGCSTLTVETFNPKQHNENYLKTYLFYEKSGFKPLFQINAYDRENLMVCMQKTLSLNDFDFIDLTHTLSPDVPHWGVDVAFKYNARLIKSAETNGKMAFRVQRLEMSSGIGTHMDAPSHCYEQAASIHDIPLSSLITPCRVIDVSDRVYDQYSVSEDDVFLYEEKYGRIPDDSFVIIYTGWDQRWSQPEKYRNEKVFPNISVKAAQLLLARNIVGIGIDTLSPDAFGSDFPVHELLLSAGKYIIENVANAKKLNPADSYVFALPMKIMDGTEAPVRLIGMNRRK